MKIPIMTLDAPNKNGHIYPREIMERELKKYEKVFIEENRAVIVNRLPESSTINLQDVVGVVKKVTIEGNKVFVEAEFFSDLYKKLIESGRFSLRTHGMGSMVEQKNGTHKIGDDYEFICCFITDDPA